MKEIRYSEIRAQVPDETGALIIEGRAIVFDQVTTINDPVGSYKEIIKRGALDGADLSDVRLLFNHDLNRLPLARTPRTMTLAVDPVGMTIRATLPDTEGAREVYESVKRRDLDGMSFAFKVPEGGDTYDPKTNTRTINKIEKVYECSIVQFPAYTQTSVEARSVMTESRERLKKLENLKTLVNMIIRGA